MLAVDVGCDIALVNKHVGRSHGSFSIVGDVKGKVAVIIQDIADGCGMS